jgi:hypothetical protein
MTCALIIRPEAEADLSRAAEWYEIRSQGLGNAFLDEANRFLESIRRTCVWRIDRVTDFAAHPAKVRQVALF